MYATVLVPGVALLGAAMPSRKPRWVRAKVSDMENQVLTFLEANPGALMPDIAVEIHRNTSNAGTLMLVMLKKGQVYREHVLLPEISKNRKDTAWAYFVAKD